MVAVGPLSWNSDITAVVGDVITARFGGAWDNYRWSGTWSRINPTFAADGASWLHDESPWSIRCPRYANGRIVLVDENEYDPHQRATRSPGDWPILEMDHPDASGQVEGIVDEFDPSRVVYANALGDGVDIVAGLWYGEGTRYPRPEHLVRVRALPPGDSDIVIYERIYTPLSIPGWNGSLREIGSTGAVLLTPNGDAGIVMLPAFAWYRADAGQGELVRIPISVTAERMAGYTRIAKTIPRWFVAAAIAAGTWVTADETTTTFYSNANPETVSVDGYVYRNGTNLTWSGIRDGAGTTANDSIAFSAGCGLDSGSSTDGWNLNLRGIYLFDTSSIGAANAVSAATFGITGNAKSNTFGTSPEMAVVASNPASNTALVAADYGTLGTTEFAPRVAYSSWSGGGGLASWAFNSTGLAAVSVSGITKIGTRSGWDLDNSPPAWLASKTMRMTGSFADIGTSAKPYLSVTYAPAVSSTTDGRSYPRGVGRGIMRGCA